MPKNQKILSILIFLFLAASVLAQKTESYSFRSLNTADGLSQGRVTKILQDQSNFLWFGTADGLNRYDGYSFLIFRHKRDNPTSISNNIINDIKETHDGKLIIATNDGLNIFDPVSQSFSRIPIYNANSPDRGYSSVTSILIPRNQKDYFYYATKAGLIKYSPANKSNQLMFELKADLAINERSIRTLFESPKGDIWIGTGGEGLFIFKPEVKTVKNILITYNSDAKQRILPITSITDDGEGQIFIADYMHVYAFDEDGAKLRDIESGPILTIPTTIIKAGPGQVYIAYLGKGLVKYSYRNSEYIFIKDVRAVDTLEQKYDFISLYIDRSNTLWCGSNGWGIQLLSPYNNLFRKFTDFSPNLKSVRSMIQLKDGSVIISGYRGFSKLNSDFSIENLNTSIYDRISGLTLSVYSLLEDINSPNDVIWVGSEGGGLFRYSLKSKDIEAVRGNFTNGDFFRGDFVTALFWGSDSLLYIGTERGLHTLNTKTNKLKFYPPTIGGESVVSFGVIYDLDEHNGSIYLSTERNGVIKFDTKTEEFSSFLSTEASSAALPTNDIRALYFKNNDTCYLATNSGFCVFDKKKNILKTFSMPDGLPNDLVYSILEDSTGKLWLSTNQGISSFDPNTGKFLNYNESDGLPGNEFNSKAYLKLRNGDLIFGGVKGFCVFNPETFSQTNLSPNLAITTFSLFSKEIPVGKYGDKVILDSAIHLKKVISLDYDENNLSVEFTALNNSVNTSTRYSYILEGFESEWSLPNTTRKAIYTNLDHGEYKFMVATINRDGTRSKNVAELHIVISPPFWKTLLFRIVASVLLIYLIYYAYKRKTESIRLRNEELERLVDNRTKQLELKKDELERNNLELQETNASKNRFFSMFAHDVRSPFTAILGYLQILNEDYDDLTREERNFYLTSLYTVSKSLFATIENVLNWFRIEMGRVSYDPKLTRLLPAIQETESILEVNIKAKRVEVIVEIEENTILFADRVMLKTILQNLLSNAVKFSAEEGIISISSTVRENFVLITISDSGEGMTPEETEKLFKKELVFSKDGTKNEKGTGLGLLICKEFVERGGGTISVLSTVGEGTSFTFSVPVLSQD